MFMLFNVMQQLSLLLHDSSCLWQQSNLELLMLYDTVIDMPVSCFMTFYDLCLMIDFCLNTAYMLCSIIINTTMVIVMITNSSILLIVTMFICIWIILPQKLSKGSLSLSTCACTIILCKRIHTMTVSLICFSSHFSKG